MKKFISGKSSLIELKGVVDKLRSSSTEPQGVVAFFDHESLTVTEMRTDSEGVSLRYVAGPGKPNVLILGNG
jgi:hypothetical protein